MAASSSVAVGAALIPGISRCSPSGRGGLAVRQAQHRLVELERAGLIEVVDKVDEASKRAVREVRLVYFRIEFSPRVIRQLVIGEGEREFRVA